MKPLSKKYFNATKIKHLCLERPLSKSKMAINSLSLTFYRTRKTAEIKTIVLKSNEFICHFVSLLTQVVQIEHFISSTKK